MNRKKSAEHSRHAPKAPANAERNLAQTNASRAQRNFIIALAASVVSLVIGGMLFADWYYGLPDDAEAKFVGRQSCIQCHQNQHNAWQGSHHDLAMDVAQDDTVLGDFKDAELTHHGITSRMFRKDSKF